MSNLLRGKLIPMLLIIAKAGVLTLFCGIKFCVAHLLSSLLCVARSHDLLSINRMSEEIGLLSHTEAEDHIGPRSHFTTCGRSLHSVSWVMGGRLRRI